MRTGVMGVEVPQIKTRLEKGDSVEQIAQELQVEVSVIQSFADEAKAAEAEAEAKKPKQPGRRTEQ